MWQRYLVVLLGLLLAPGCSCPQQTTPPGSKQQARGGTLGKCPTAPQPPCFVVSATSDAQTSARKGGFGLPLEYKIEVPEVPDELLKPSPPIR